jgi:hypothetical protein
MTFYQNEIRVKYHLLFILVTITYFVNAQGKEELLEDIKSLLIEQKLSGAVWATVSETGEITSDAYGCRNAKTRSHLVKPIKYM